MTHPGLAGRGITLWCAAPWRSQPSGGSNYSARPATGPDPPVFITRSRKFATVAITFRVMWPAPARAATPLLPAALAPTRCRNVAAPAPCDRGQLLASDPLQVEVGCNQVSRASWGRTKGGILARRLPQARQHHAERDGYLRNITRERDGYFGFISRCGMATIG